MGHNIENEQQRTRHCSSIAAEKISISLYVADGGTYIRIDRKSVFFNSFAYRANLTIYLCKVVFMRYVMREDIWR